MLNFIQRLKINDNVITVKDSNVVLTLNRSGRARFLVYSESPFSSGVKVEFESGYQGKMISSWFIGFVETSVEVKKNIYRIFCRELSAVYSFNTFVSIRSATIPKITKALSDKTGVAFSVPDKPYSKTKVPNFVGLNRGIDSINKIGEVFGIDDYIWFVQSDYSIFIGSHKDSIFNDLNFNLDRSVFNSLTSHGGELQLITGLLPAVTINGRRITEVSINNDRMELSWLTD